MISGGTMSGYCAVGSDSIATMPTITVRIAITMATIGRRMKNLDMSYLAPVGLEVSIAACSEISCTLTCVPSRSFCTLLVITLVGAKAACDNPIVSHLGTEGYIHDVRFVVG